MTILQPQGNRPKFSLPWWVILCYVGVWQLLAMHIDQTILLASPVETVEQVYLLVIKGGFWLSIFSSFCRILTGFLLAVVVGVLFSALSYKSKAFSQLVTPLILMAKAVPVASFIILVLIWFSSKNLSVIISFIMALPVMYQNILSGLQTLDKELSQMSRVFRLTPYAHLRYVVCPQLLSYFTSASLVSIGLCFKAGIAAEVIGLPKMSIGEHLYEAKVFLDTPSLFAWTLVIVVLSFLVEKLLMLLIEKASKRLMR